LRQFAVDQGFRLRRKHHEIFLNDPRRAGGAEDSPAAPDREASLGLDPEISLELICER